MAVPGDQARARVGNTWRGPATGAGNEQHAAATAAHAACGNQAEGAPPIGGVCAAGTTAGASGRAWARADGADNAGAIVPMLCGLWTCGAAPIAQGRSSSGKERRTLLGRLRLPARPHTMGPAAGAATVVAALSGEEVAEDTSALADPDTSLLGAGDRDERLSTVAAALSGITASGCVAARRPPGKAGIPSCAAGHATAGSVRIELVPPRPDISKALPRGACATVRILLCACLNGDRLEAELECESNEPCPGKGNPAATNFSKGPRGAAGKLPARMAPTTCGSLHKPRTRRVLVALYMA